jgi:exodeoxyribonuclease VII large subunit
MIRSQLENSRRTVLFSEPARALREHRQTLDRLCEDQQQAGEGQIHARRLVLERASAVLVLQSPARRIAETKNLLENSRMTMQRACEDRLRVRMTQLEKQSAVLAALSPASALDRGYTLTLAEDGKLIRNPEEVRKGDALVTRFAKGSIRSVVEGSGT